VAENEFRKHRAVETLEKATGEIAASPTGVTAGSDVLYRFCASRVVP
jgi:hypothetical protein